MTVTTDDEFLGGRLRILQPAKGYRAGVDPVLLAASVDARAGQSVLELGTGAGTALLCLNARVPGLFLTGVELQPDLAGLARENFERNGLYGNVITSDLANLPEEVRDRTFDHVIANPPYFERDRGSVSSNDSREAGRGEVTPLSVWIDVATRRLAPKGYLTIIQRAERIKDIFTAFDGRLGSIVLRPIAARIGRNAELIIAQARKGGRAKPRILAPFVLHEGDRHDADRDSYTAAARAILREGHGFPK